MIIPREMWSQILVQVPEPQISEVCQFFNEMCRDSGFILQRVKKWGVEGSSMEEVKKKIESLIPLATLKNAPLFHYPAYYQFFMIQNLEIKLAVLPEELNLFTNLKKVNLSFNSFHCIPAYFGRTWKKLERCDLNDNKLEKLPENFGETWENLERLDLSSCKLKELPPGFGESWKKIKHLFLLNNLLTERPLRVRKKCNIYLERNPLQKEAVSGGRDPA